MLSFEPRTNRSIIMFTQWMIFERLNYNSTLTSFDKEVNQIYFLKYMN